MDFSILAFNTDETVVPVQFTSGDVGATAIVPLSFGMVVETNSVPIAQSYAVNAGLDSFRIEVVPDASHNNYGNVVYAAGVATFKPLVQPSANSIATFNLKTVPLTSYAGTLALPSGTITVGGSNYLRPGSVRFLATLKVFSKVSVVAASNHKLDTQETSEKETSVQVLVVDKPVYTGLVDGEYVDGVSSVTGELHFFNRGSSINAGTVNYATGAVVLNYEHTAASPGVFLYSAIPDFELMTIVGTDALTKSYTWDKICNVLHGMSGFMNQGVPDHTVTPRQRYALTHSQTATGVNYSHTGETETSRTFNFPLTSLTTNVPVPTGGTLAEVTFTLGGTQYVTQDDNVVSAPSPSTGVGTVVGSIAPSTGVVTLTAWAQGASSTASDVTVATIPPASAATCHSITIRTASAPLRPGSFSVSGVCDSFNHEFTVSFNATADLDGYIDHPNVAGIVDYARGVARLWFFNAEGQMSTWAPNLLKDFSHLGIPGVTNRYQWHARTASLRYNAVAYSYLPLNADLLGIDPVRLPSDGRVPIFRPGGFVVVGHTGEVTATVSNAQTVSCARTRLSRVRVIGDNGTVINTGYSADLNAGTVTFSDVSGYSQPVNIQHRIEDMMMASDVQLNGQLTFTRALTHDYPLGSYVSSALVVGDLRARVSVVFDQATWNGSSWLDAVSGSAAVATFNDAQFPITVTNCGTLTERWMVQFTNTTAFNVIGEHVGVIATGNVSTNCAPLNPATNVPYFTIPAGGWGAGWTTGNVLRFNTIGSIFPVWCVRTVQQGPETVTDDNFTILVRGDIDTP